MGNELTRGAGVLLPISSLPSPYGIGTLGRAAYEFVDKLKRSGQKYWQVLPIGPTSYGDSPYQSFSTFAGNPYFIDLDFLIEEELLSVDDVNQISWCKSEMYVEYDLIYNERYKVLRKAFHNSKHSESYDFLQFKSSNSFWLHDYALFMSIKEKHNNREWLTWEDDIKFRHPDAIAGYEEALKNEIDFYEFLQYKFYSQWMALKKYANENGIMIIGDIPIYVALDSADVWTNPKLYQLDSNLLPVDVAGCPPDAFSTYGQKWGNPLYDWDRMAQDDFSWWKRRIRTASVFYDITRIDHFIGIVRYYCIPFDKEPKDGCYKDGPGIKLIKAIDSARGDSKIIAEDLGVVIPKVNELIKESGYPGMKVLQFAFDGGTKNPYLPYNSTSNYVVYTGTHDNDTNVGFIESADTKTIKYMKAYFNTDSIDEISDALIRSAYSSVADTAIIQMQDWLGKGNEARMNLPSTLGCNWKWRMKNDEYDEALIMKMREISITYGRDNCDNYFEREKYMLSDICKERYDKKISECNNNEIYFALLELTKKLASERAVSDNTKKIYYISAEFLIGKLLSNNLINLGIFDSIKEELEANGKSIYEIEEIEPEPSLGNGGLGRLAACFLDSMASLGLNGDGIGLNYHMGLFKQVFENNFQKETPNPWMENEGWFTKTDIGYDIEFGNLKVKSKLFDIDVTGYNNQTNKLHLFDIESVDESIIKGDSIHFDKEDITKNLTLFLYPDDSDEAGNLLRIYQQYFMVSNAAQFILDECENKGSNLHNLADYAAIQINDTHPSMVIPELVRLLEKKGIEFDEAVKIVTEVCAYTNHTILAEALEKWPLKYLEKVVPNLVPIIKKLDELVRAKYDDPSVYIIDASERVHMAHMDIHYGHSVNGVAYLHTEILKNTELNNFYKIYPDKFNNKTNGITFRRWLLHCNEELSSYIEELIGNEFKTNADELEKLLQYKNDEAVLNKILEIKRLKKKELADFLKTTQGITIDANSIYDTQVKRLHEYKRQQMNVLWVIHKYLEIKKGIIPKTPITVIFGAKAAPAYVIAKDIIHLILCLQEVINNDSEVNAYLKIVMVENYNVSKAAKIIPACDISEQISLASKEASGTGNMKFMLNGAVTLGTKDGANVEIGELVGEDNIYFFGENSEQVIEHYRKMDYSAKKYYVEDADIKEMVDFIISVPVMKAGDAETLLRLHAELIKKDWFMTLLDIKDYIRVKELALAEYEDRKAWASKMLVNIAKAGFFSSDRTIAQYNEDIWKL